MSRRNLARRSVLERVLRSATPSQPFLVPSIWNRSGRFSRLGTEPPTLPAEPGREAGRQRSRYGLESAGSRRARPTTLWGQKDWFERAGFCPSAAVGRQKPARPSQARTFPLADACDAQVPCDRRATCRSRHPGVSLPDRSARAHPVHRGGGPAKRAAARANWHTASRCGHRAGRTP